DLIPAVVMQTGRTARGPPGHVVLLASAVYVGRSRLLDDGIVVLEDLDDLGGRLALFGNFLPEHLRGVFDGLPLLGRNAGELQLRALGTQLRLATPVPLITVVVAGLNRRHDQRFQVVWQFSPLLP